MRGPLGGPLPPPSSRITYPVTANRTVPQLLPELETMREDGLPVLATAGAVGVLEEPCRQALRRRLRPGEKVAGIAVDIRHLAASAPGAVLTVEANCISIDGDYYQFAVVATDHTGTVVARGTIAHKIVNEERFLRALRRRRPPTVAGTASPATVPAPDASAVSGLSAAGLGAPAPRGAAAWPATA